MWLKISEGQTVRIKILDGRPEARSTHWVDGKSVLCTGNGCHYCRQGKRVKKSFIYNVEDDQGRQWKWEFGSQVLKQLIAHEPDPLRRQGAWVEVKRLGTGLQTSYMVLKYQPPVPTNSTPKAPTTPEQPKEDVTEWLMELTKSIEAIKEQLERAEAALRVVMRSVTGEEVSDA